MRAHDLGDMTGDLRQHAESSARNREPTSKEMLYKRQAVNEILKKKLGI